MTVTQNIEKIEDESCVIPLKVDVVHALCTTCTPLLPKDDKNKSIKLTLRRAIDEFFDIFVVRTGGRVPPSFSHHHCRCRHLKNN